MGSLGVWLKDLISRERRRAKRKSSSALVAYYWDGSAPVAHTVRDASTTGFYLLTDQRWYRGTMIRMTLQEASKSSNGKGRSIEVLARVIRSGEDGVGLAFVMRNYDEASQYGQKGAKALKKFLRHLEEPDSHTLIEDLGHHSRFRGTPWG